MNAALSALSVLVCAILVWVVFLIADIADMRHTDECHAAKCEVGQPHRIPQMGCFCLQKPVRP